jgi:hypothetical protein
MPTDPPEGVVLVRVADTVHRPVAARPDMTPRLGKSAPVLAAAIPRQVSLSWGRFAEVEGSLNSQLVSLRCAQVGWDNLQPAYD